MSRALHRGGRGPGAWAFRFAALILIGLGALWAVDRAQRWETPAFDARRFEVLAGGEPEVERSQASWLMAVNPRCPHCMAGLERLRVSQVSAASAARLVVLVVDTPRRPAPALVSRLGADAVWWDRRGVWRGRWGHRLYGEVLRFDAAGRYLGSVPADGLTAMATSGSTEPPAAPASERR